MNTRVRESKETKGLTIEGIDKVRGKNVYVDTKNNTLHSVRVTLSSIRDTTYSGRGYISQTDEFPIYSWILDRSKREVRIFKGKKQTPFHTHSLTSNDLKTPQSLRNLIGDIVWDENQTNGTKHSTYSQIPAPYTTI